jgi:hypothetical protein
MALHILFFLKSLRSLEEFRKNHHVKIPPKSPPTNFQSLGIFKNQILFEKEFSSDFGPSGPAPPALARFAPQATGSPLSPFGPNNFCVFAERRISFDFAHSGRDAFSLSRHCHVGPACQLHPLPHASRPIAASPHRLRPPCAARPPTSRCQARSSLPALIPPFNSPPP